MLRADTVHQLTSRLAKTQAVVGIEARHVPGMLKNHRLAQALAAGGFGKFRRQLTYTAAGYGGHVMVADRWCASSKTCSCCCGWVDEMLTLADRTFQCR